MVTLFAYLLLVLVLVDVELFEIGFGQSIQILLDKELLMELKLPSELHDREAEDAGEGSCAVEPYHRVVPFLNPQRCKENVRQAERETKRSTRDAVLQERVFLALVIILDYCLLIIHYDKSVDLELLVVDRLHLIFVVLTEQGSSKTLLYFRAVGCCLLDRTFKSRMI